MTPTSPASELLGPSQGLPVALYPHQEKALARWLAQPCLGLALQAGLGKTRTVLTGIEQLIEVDRWLVVAPKRVVTNVWPAEASRWGLLRGQLAVLGAEDFRLWIPKDWQPGMPKDWRPGELLFRDLKATRAHLRELIAAHRVTVVSWDWVFWLAAALGDKPHFDGIVLDESHYVKTKSTKRFQAVRRLARGCSHRVALNGTPLTNGWEDTWSQSFLLDGGKAFCRTLGDFRAAFCQVWRDPAHPQIVHWTDPSPAQEAQLQDRFRQLWLPMESADWVKMPDLIVNDVWVDLPTEADALATRLMRAALSLLPSGTKILPPSVAAGLNKAIQVCQGFVYNDEGREEIHDAKVQALGELFDSTSGGVLVFYEFQADRLAIRGALQDDVAFIDEAGALESWSAGRVRALAAHPGSMAVGLNLQARGNTVIWYGVTWDYWLYHQGIARMHRLGQESPSVIVHRILTRHLVERAQLDALERKGGLLNTVMKLKGEVCPPT